MKLAFAVLADHVESADGKLFISGTFDVFNVQQFPAMLPMAGLAVKIEATHGEAGGHTFTVGLRDEDGQLVVPQINGEFPLGEGRFVKGAPPAFQMALNLGGLQFANAGTYEFEILVDGRHVGSVPFHVVQIGNAPAA